jgi:hypothetical protein
VVLGKLHAMFVKELVQASPGYSRQPRRLGYIATCGKLQPAQIFKLTGVFMLRKINTERIIGSFSRFTSVEI